MNHATGQYEWSYWVSIHLLNSEYLNRSTCTGHRVQTYEVLCMYSVYTSELSLGVLQMHAKSSEHSNEIRESEHVPSNNDQPNY